MMKFVTQLIIILLFGLSQLNAGLIPDIGSKGVPVDTDLIMEFNEPVRIGEEGTITIIDAKNNEVFTEISIDSKNINIEENILTVNLDNKFAKSDYYVLISSKAIRDIAGNYYKGIDEPNFWNFSTVEENPNLEINGLNLASKSGRVKIKWEALNQHNIKGYELYRSENNAAGAGEFKLIDSYELNEKLLVNDLNDYSKIDTDPDLIAGNYYSYKLVSIDKDGNRNIESVEEVEIVNIGQISIGNISPNPVTDKELNFDLTLNENQNITVEILNNNGNLLNTIISNKNYSSGTHNLSVSLKDSEIASGSYILKVTNGEDAQFKKFVIIK